MSNELKNKLTFLAVLAIPAEGLVLGGRLGARLQAARTLVALLIALQQKEKLAVSVLNLTDANRRPRPLRIHLNF